MGGVQWVRFTMNTGIFKPKEKEAKSQRPLAGAGAKPRGKVFGTVPRRIMHAALPWAFCLMLAGCDAQPEAAPDASAVAEQEQQANETAKSPVERETTVGPVHAVVRLGNENPVLGEPVELVLRVDAAEGVRVTMPEFGDQLGRFGISDYAHAERILPDGRSEYEQKYVLDLPHSGKLRTPSFLVEFIDARKDSPNPEKIQELLTDEIGFEVASVFADGKVPPELYPVRGELGELVLPTVQRNRVWLWALIGLAVVAVAGIVIWRVRRPKPKVVLPPDVVAMRALEAMKAESIPTEPKAVDAWYVRLSSVVREYIEGRFALEAPRMTTEEFLELARRSDAIREDHKKLLHRLLERSDRVKFTGFVPPSKESAELLDDAYRFVQETREVVEEGGSHVGIS